MYKNDNFSTLSSKKIEYLHFDDFLNFIINYKKFHT